MVGETVSFSISSHRKWVTAGLSAMLPPIGSFRGEEGYE
jgi:hypothetical protein